MSVSLIHHLQPTLWLVPQPSEDPPAASASGQNTSEENLVAETAPFLPTWIVLVDLLPAEMASGKLWTYLKKETLGSQWTLLIPLCWLQTRPWFIYTCIYSVCFGPTSDVFDPEPEAHGHWECCHCLPNQSSQTSLRREKDQNCSVALVCPCCPSLDHFRIKPLKQLARLITKRSLSRLSGWPYKAICFASFLCSSCMVKLWQWVKAVCHGKVRPCTVAASMGQILQLQVVY